MNSNFIKYYQKDERENARLFLSQNVSLSPADAETEVFHISNTASKTQTSDFLKKIGIYLENQSHLVLDGQGNTVSTEGKLIYMMLKGCKNITVENTVFQYRRPTVSEFTVISAEKKKITVKIDPSSHYKIINRKLVFVGPEGNYYDGKERFLLTQEYNPAENTTARLSSPVSWKKNLLKFHKAKEIAPNTVELTFLFSHEFKNGCTYEFRNIVRDQVGFFLERSENITFRNCTVHDMHGLGVVGEFCKNVRFENCRFVPSEGRKTTGFADLIHMIGCSGEISVENCTFDGAHDDCLNVHGIHFTLAKRIDDKTVAVKFSHGETFGFPYFDAGDRIEFVRKDSLLPCAKNVVASAKMQDDSTILLTLESPICALPENLVVEDIDKNNANLVFRNNSVYNIPTRGVLATNGGTVTIQNNTFYKTGMSAILIADDANSWYESGRIKSAEISDNRFIDCASPVILIEPVYRNFQGAIHGPVKITNNEFTQNGVSVSADGAESVEIKNNRFANETKAVILKNTTEI